MTATMNPPWARASIIRRTLTLLRLGSRPASIATCPALKSDGLAGLATIARGRTTFAPSSVARRNFAAQGLPLLIRLSVRIAMLAKRFEP